MLKSIRLPLLVSLLLLLMLTLASIAWGAVFNASFITYTDSCQFYLYDLATGYNRLLFAPPWIYTRSIAWSPDENQLAFSHASQIMLLDTRLGSSQREPAVIFPQHYAWGELDFSPDGKQLAFWGGVTKGDQRGLFIGSLETGDVRRLPVETVDVTRSYVVWSPDGRWLAYTTPGTDVEHDFPSHNLYLIDLETDEIEQITSDEHYERVYDWSPDGKTIVLWSSRGQDYLTFLYDVSSGAFTPVDPERMVFDGRWLPDGRLQYQTQDALYLMNADGSNRQRLLDARHSFCGGGGE